MLEAIYKNIITIFLLKILLYLNIDDPNDF